MITICFCQLYKVMVPVQFYNLCSFNCSCSVSWMTVPFIKNSLYLLPLTLTRSIGVRFLVSLTPLQGSVPSFYHSSTVLHSLLYRVMVVSLTPLQGYVPSFSHSSTGLRFLFLTLLQGYGSCFSRLLYRVMSFLLSLFYRVTVLVSLTLLQGYVPSFSHSSRGLRLLFLTLFYRVTVLVSLTLLQGYGSCFSDSFIELWFLFIPLLIVMVLVLF